MHIEEGIRTLLLASPEVANLVGERIAPYMIPDEKVPSELPAITYALPFERPLTHLSRVALTDRPWFGQADRPIERIGDGPFRGTGVSGWVGQTDRIHRYAEASETSAGVARFRRPPGGFR